MLLYKVEILKGNILNDKNILKNKKEEANVS